jgi:hypothetical protein|tara:strand:- start:116 stop:322 length:207 start_codon:yes stop_codon:yes gene_type:complete
MEWSQYYQKVFFLMLYELLVLYPFVKREETGRLALKFIRTEFKGVKDEIDIEMCETRFKANPSVSRKS